MVVAVRRRVVGCDEGVGGWVSCVPRDEEEAACRVCVQLSCVPDGLAVWHDGFRHGQGGLQRRRGAAADQMSGGLAQQKCSAPHWPTVSLPNPTTGPSPDP